MSALVSCSVRRAYATTKTAPQSGYDEMKSRIQQDRERSQSPFYPSLSLSRLCLSFPDSASLHLGCAAGKGQK